MSSPARDAIVISGVTEFEAEDAAERLLCWTGTDRLNDFISDVRDGELRRVFDECGLGHLLELLNPDVMMELREGVAKSTRKYLGMALPGA